MNEKLLSKRRWLAPVVALTCLTSCYRATFHRDPDVVKGETHEQWTDFFLFGLVGTEEFTVQQFCPNGDVAEVKTGGNFATGLVGLVTIGIYTPRKVYVSCANDAAGRSARRLELDFNRAGEPVFAAVAGEDGQRQLEITASGERHWRLALGEGADHE